MIKSVFDITWSIGAFFMFSIIKEVLKAWSCRQEQ